MKVCHLRIHERSSLKHKDTYLNAKQIFTLGWSEYRVSSMRASSVPTVPSPYNGPFFLVGRWRPLPRNGYLDTVIL